jgi:hypothetical protein
VGEVIRSWRKWCDEELHDLHHSPNIVRMMLSRRMGLAQYVACGREESYVHSYRWEKVKKRD